MMAGQKPSGIPEGKWWALIEPAAIAWRTDDNDEGTWDKFEWLTKTFARMDKQAHVHRDVSDAAIRKALPAVLATNTKALRSAEASRTMIVQSAPPPQGSQHRRAVHDEGGAAS